MAGWDVALTNKGVLLLETNLSCNFFRGTFDEDLYFNMVHEYFCLLEGDAKQIPLMTASTMTSKLHGCASRESFTTQVDSGSSDAPSSDSDSEPLETLVQRRTAR
jgi:hypothetical protein